jgi:hypothetical protein
LPFDLSGRSSRSRPPTPQKTTTKNQSKHKKKTVLGIILGGGAGTRLYPLTKKRAKPAVPLGANYRLIDIPVSNCVNSNVTKIYCLTQFNSASLNRHLSLAYNSSVTSVSRGFVEVLAASQSAASKNWFQGTADAVRQYMWLFEEAVRDGVQDFLVLSGALDSFPSWRGAPPSRRAVAPRRPNAQPPTPPQQQNKNRRPSLPHGLPRLRPEAPRLGRRHHHRRPPLCGKRGLLVRRYEDRRERAGDGIRGEAQGRCA